ncbi:MAG: phosphodiesterase [Thermovenabulum sp.]|uniref:phosphodiesterase n=1 Tax=Thermovenabulum sp. TaxID=3100335 RepID=UPI003C7E54F0
MKIGLISDTHGSVEGFLKAFKILKECDLIVHTGDVLYHGPRNPLPPGYNPQKLAEILNEIKIPIIAACGNCDAAIDQLLLKFPLQNNYALIYFNAKKIMALHGHDKPIEEWLKLCRDWKVDFLITGHTHVKTIEKIDDIILINPGSPSLPKDGIPSCGIILEDVVRLYNIDTKEITMEFKLI